MRLAIHTAENEYGEFVMRRSPYLITGASGFFGRHLIAALREAGEPTPLALVRDEAAWDMIDWQRQSGPVPGIAGVVGDVGGWDGDPRLQDVGGVFHLAGVVKHSRRDTAEMWQTNVAGTLNMVRFAAARRCRMVYVSTSGTVGCFTRPEETADEDAPFCETRVSHGPYYMSKIAAEKAARDLADELGVTLVIVRPPVLLGPGDHKYRSSSNILRLLRGKLPFMLKGGMHFIDVRDAADALVAAMRIDAPRPVYHLNGTASTLVEFFQMCADVSGDKLPKLHLHPRLLAGLAKANQLLGDAALHLLPDPVVTEMAAHYWGLTSRYANLDLGYQSRPPHQTLSDAIAWLRQEHPALRGAPHFAAPVAPAAGFASQPQNLH
jgi:dihydroflavonol-4-reductase